MINMPAWRYGRRPRRVGEVLWGGGLKGGAGLPLTGRVESLKAFKKMARKGEVGEARRRNEDG